MTSRPARQGQARFVGRRVGDIGIDRIGHASGQGGGIHLDHVVAGGQVAKEVLAVLVGVGGLQQRLAGVIVAIAVEVVVQFDAHAFQPFAGVKVIAGIAVEEDGVADQSIAAVVPVRGIGKVLVQVAGGGQVGHGADVGRARAVAVVGGGQVAEHVLGVVDPHQVIICAVPSARQVGEQVLPVGVGDVAGDDRLAGIPDAVAIRIRIRATVTPGRRGSAGIECAVAVGIQPHGVADIAAVAGGRVAEVGVDVHIAWGQQDGRGGAVVAGGAAGRTGHGRGRRSGCSPSGAAPPLTLHGISAGRQAVEDIVASGIGGGGGSHHIVRRAQDAIRRRG